MVRAHRLVVLTGLAPALALSPGEPPPAGASSPGSSGSIVFISNRGANGYHLWLSREGGSGITRLNRRGFSPSWSPDGRRIAFVSHVNGTTSGASEIFLTDAGGHSARRLTRNRVEDSSPTWSPDGSQILFVAGRRDLYVMNADGTGRRRLARTRLCEVAASWSPDGSRIAFTHLCGGNTPALYVMNEDGRGARRVASWGGGPAWSPDGLQIAFHGPVGITVADADGSNSRNIAGGFRPTWSPDGRELAFTRVEFVGKPRCDTVARIFAVEVDGSNERRVTPVRPCGAHDDDPDWQRRCTSYGTARTDRLAGTAERDIICALAGHDNVQANAGPDVVIGGDGKDAIDGGADKDWLFGSAGSDLLLARDGESDIVNGGPGRDRARVDPELDRVSSVEELLP